MRFNASLMLTQPQVSASPVVSSAVNEARLASPGPTAPADETPLVESMPESPTAPTAVDKPSSAAITYRAWNDTLENGNRQLKGLYIATKNKTASAEEMQRRIRDVQLYLHYLEHEVVPSPQLKDCNVDRVLNLIRSPPENHGPVQLPEDIVASVFRIYDKFQDENWGAEASAEELENIAEDAPNVVSSAAQSEHAARTDIVVTAVVLLPPPNHRIWGISGIMHGLARQTRANGRFSYIFDPRYLREKVNFKVFGHNGLTPGDWWAFQRLALFHGAHGSAGGGISGSADHGCYSIVISGKSKYHEMDKDEGETLFYSADNSVDNVNRERVDIVTNQTKSLQRSLENRRPVRVLRSEGKHGAFAPIAGIRYDGLYLVVDEQVRTNPLGGKYLQFKLERAGNQRPWRETLAAAPTAQQQSDFRRLREGY